MVSRASGRGHPTPEQNINNHFRESHGKAILCEESVGRNSIHRQFSGDLLRSIATQVVGLMDKQVVSLPQQLSR